VGAAPQDRRFALLRRSLFFSSYRCHPLFHCKAMSDQSPNCWQCRYFRITHIPATPYACGFMGFQSKALPCIEVLRADGTPCRALSVKLQPSARPNA